MSTTKNAKKVQSTLEKLQPSLHPVKEHPLSNCEEFVQKLYITQLCVMAEYQNKDVENSLKFVQRIMAGAKLKENITEYRKNAMEMKLEQIEEFILQCKENKLCDVFIIDSLLLTMGNGKANQKQIGYLAEMAEALGIDKKRMGYLCEIAVCILEQDSEKYQKVSVKIPHDKRHEIVECVIGYLKEFVIGVLVDTDEMFYVYAPEKTEIKLENNNINNKKRVILENLVLKDGNTNLSFESCQNITMKNCEYNQNSISLIGNNEILFSDCIFDGANLSSRYWWLYIEETENICFENCCIKNIICKASGSYNNSGRLIRVNRKQENQILQIKNSELCNLHMEICFVSHGTFGSPNIDINIEDSRFNNVKRIYPIRNYAKNCEFINCD